MAAEQSRLMRTIRFHEYGEPADVLRAEAAAIPNPGPDRIRVRVEACGLNPADWALCRGLFGGALPRGVGLDVSGVVDAVGEGVTGVSIGDPVLGSADFAGYASAGASDYAVLNHWTRVPPGLDLIQAAALPMAIETAYRCIDSLGVAKDQTLLVHGAGTMMGFAAVQMALMRGARVIATAGETFSERLRALGASVTGYGDGMVERVLAMTAGQAPDLIFDAGPISGVLPDLVKIANGDAHRVLTVSNHGPAAEALGVRNSFTALRYDVLGDFAQLAAEGRFIVPIARTFALEDWREAVDISVSRRAQGKLMLLPAAAAARG
jgi:NADPH:quinone reductase-like Zn-dependent oxidoreductase